ncbi:MAG: response regulator transcription factor [Bacillota bacterium]|nr:response regulator transcription factor [Bacillota bacterium]
MKILIVEDEAQISSRLADFFHREGWQAVIAADGEVGLALAKTENPDLVILDLMLPKLSGIEVCKKIRTYSSVPIIMLTAKSEEIDKLLGLELGADDYVTKPFSLSELVARAKAIMRRQQGQLVTSGTLPVSSIIKQGPFTLDIDAHAAYKGSDLLDLTPTEFKLLETFCKSPERVFTRSQLINQVLGHFFPGFDRTIDTHVSNLRKKIEQEPSTPIHLLTVHGVGYRFSAGEGAN